MKMTRLPSRTRLARVLPILSTSILAATAPWLTAANSDTWNNFNAINQWNVPGNWLDGTVPLTPDPTADLIFGGSGVQTYTANNDLVGFLLNTLTLNSTSTVAENITGNSMDFRIDGADDPAITQSGTGAFTIGNNLIATGALRLAGTGTGIVTLNGVVSGAGGITANMGTYQLGNAANSFSGGLTINTGATVEVLPSGAGNQAVNLTSTLTTSFLGTNAGNANTINGGTLKITTKGSGGIATSGITVGGRSLTFNTNGGTLDLRNTSGVANTQGGGIVSGDFNLTLNNSLANPAVIKFNGGQVGLSNNSATDGNWVIGANALRIGSLNGSGPLRIELTNGAMARASIVAGGTDAQNTIGVGLTLRGVVGGDPTSGTAGLVNTGLSLTTGRYMLDSGRVIYSNGLVIEGAIQVCTNGRAAGLAGNITVAPNGYAAFQGRSTGTGVASAIIAPGGTTNPGNNVLWVGENASTTLTVQGGGIAVLDGRLRYEQANTHGVLLGGNAVLNPGGTLRIAQSVSNFSAFAQLTTTQNEGDIILRGNITGQGTAASESVLDIKLPAPDAAGTIANGVPTPLIATTPAAGTRPYTGLVAEATNNLIVNGTDFGGLRVNATARPDRLFSATGLAGGAAIADPTSNLTKINAYLTPARLAAVSGTGGYLTVAPAGQVYAFPTGGEWTDTDIGLKTVNHNAGGTDVSLSALATWGKNLAVDTGATLDTGAALILTAGTLGGTGTVISTGGTLTVDTGATVAPGFSVGTLTVGNLTLNGTLQIETTSTPTTDLLTVAGNLSLGAASILSLPITNTLGITPYTIATYSGTLGGTFGTISGLPIDYSLSYGTGTASSIRILYTPPPQEVWNGNLSGTWDTTAQNWQGPTTFVNGHKAVFDDTASGPNLIVSVSGGDVMPSQIKVNNTTKDYTLISSGGAAIAGSAQLAKSGTGTLTLSGPATYSGGTSIAQGTVKLGSNDALPDMGAVLVSLGATLNTQGNTDTVADLNVDGTATGGGTLTVSSLTLGSGATFTPNLGLNGPLTKNGAIGSTLPGAVNLGAGPRVITVASGTAPELTLNGVISNGGLTKSGNGTLILGNAGNNYGDGTTLSSGTLKVGVAGAIPASTPLTVNGGTLDGSNTALVVSSLAGTGGTVSLGSGSLLVAQGIDTTFSGAITGVASVTKSNVGVLTLNGGGNLYSGGLYATGGIVIVASVSAPGTGISHVQTGTLQVGATLTNPILLEGGTLSTQNSPGQVTSNNLTAATATTSSVLLAPATNLAANSEVILLGTLRGSGNIDVFAGTNNGSPDGGPGFRLRGTGSSDFTGTITAAQSVKLEMQTTVAGAFSPANTGKFVLTGGLLTGGTNGTYSVINIRNGSTGNAVLGNNFEVAGTDFALFNMPGGSPVGAITQLGSLKIGDNQAVGVYRNAGNLQVLQFTSVTLTGGTSKFASNPIGFGASGTANLLLGPIGQSAPSSIVLAPGTNTTLGTGTIILSAASNYSGSTTLPVGTTGTVLLGAAGALPVTTALSVNGGTLDLNNAGTSNNQTVSSLEGTGGTITNSDVNLRTFTVNQATDTEYSGTIGAVATTPLALTKTGAGHLTLSGPQKEMALNANGGVTTLKSVLGTGTSTINVDGKLETNMSQTLASLTIGAGGVFVLDSTIASPAPALAPDDFLDAAPLAGGNAAAVPEPGALSLLALGALGLLGRRKK